MGTDIHGWVEARQTQQGVWTPVADVEDFIPTRKSLAFAVVFGARFNTNFTSLIPKRGLPPDVSPEVRELATPDEEPGEEELRRGLQPGENWDAHSHTFATWAELSRFIWDGPLRYGWSDASELWRIVIRPVGWTGTTGAVLVAGRSVRSGDDISLRDAYSYFEPLFRQMETLAVSCGAANVRVVVWFDS